MSVELLQRGLHMKSRLGTEAASLWFEKQGISPELATIALVGSNRARHYGVHVSRIAQRGWNK